MDRQEKFTRENFEKLKTGDKDSFDLLYQDHYLILYRTALLILGNKEDAEDALQESFIAIYKNIASLSDYNKLKPWIFSILKNSCYTRYRKRKREFPDEFVLEKADSNSISKEEDDFLLSNEVEAALLNLKEKEREVLVLFYYNDFSIEEIVKICNSFTGTIKSRLYRARKNLKKELIKVDKDYLERESIYE